MQPAPWGALESHASAFTTHARRSPALVTAEAAQRARNAWLAGREDNLGAVKPGASALVLQFSSQDGAQVFRFPWYQRFQRWVEPLLQQVRGARAHLHGWRLGNNAHDSSMCLLACPPALRLPPSPPPLQILGPADAGNVMRLQLARMPPRSEILPHLDTGGYAAEGHRIHVIVQSNPGADAGADKGAERGGVCSAAGLGGQAPLSWLAWHTCLPRADQCCRAVPIPADVSFRVCGPSQDQVPARQGAGDAALHADGQGGGAGCVPLHVEEGLVFELVSPLLSVVPAVGVCAVLLPAAPAYWCPNR